MKKIFNFQFSIFNSKKGFTLVEMLIYMGLLSILIVIMVDLFASSLDVQLESQATSAVQQDARFLLSRLTYDVQNAQNVLVPATIGSQSASLQLSINSVNYTYALNNGNIQLTNNNGTDNLNSFDTTVSNLTFKKLGNGSGKDTVQIVFTLTSKVVRNTGAETKNFQTTVGLR